MLYLKNPDRTLRHLIAAPLITSVIIPLVILDLWAEIYHRICFPLYGFACVERSRYIKIDRYKLKYLNFWQKGYCLYCGYGNGLAGYWVKIAAETERYWCGIKHEANGVFIPPAHHKDFAKYNDEADFIKKYKS